MALVAYSDSEASDNEAPPAPKPALKTAPKPSFHKVVDRSHPGKIKVNIYSAPKPQLEKDDIEKEAPPAKKARTGGGLSGFNAMLPAPKKPNASVKDTKPSGSRSGGFGGFKTSAEPAFERRTVEERDYGEVTTEINPTLREPEPAVTPQPESAKKEATAKPTVPRRFVPLSVAREMKKNKNKRTVTHAFPPSTSTTTAPKSVSALTAVPTTAPTPKPKVSLFSIPQEEEARPAPSTSDGQYIPLLYGADKVDDARVPNEAFETGSYDQQTATHTAFTPASTSSTGPQTLNDIASSLNLSEAERRQLFGRKRGTNGPDLSSVNIVEFNTDKEYAHNEQLRAQGETVQHHALKSITGTGKNSLKSLINVVTTQKDALEEHFAQGRRNKKEAGSKYGF
ncbi:hypothetical protein GQ43DRAFT_182104 [Delitschia confertaspora ATCC 74209]|uniref:Mitotic checkpoint regulator, MAD2B-interacting-domain-containing protein n=1 Tax=Delitschia confertaspora ATCC 74209 TaxID=1513339 RepID=A0A9P4MP76_9PLEO|nr:hypothetical protein GQ43DRAFT_182104 [Delitschia confertaspora ATCC 74209]